MSLAKVVSELGPVVLQQMIAMEQRAGRKTELLETLGPDVLEGVTDALLAQEHQQDSRGKAKFCASLAADLLHGWPGEPSIGAATEAVKIAKHLMLEAEKAFTAV